MKKLIYFPAIGHGTTKDFLLKQRKLQPDLSSRFYETDFPEPWRYPYFLLSYGNNDSIRDTKLRSDLNLTDKNSIVIGDSGGFQVAKGSLKYTKDLPLKVFNWLEENSTIAMNLDIPTYGQFSGRYNDALDLSYNNFKLFESKQTGKTQFLTVLQGGNEVEFSKWYNKVKDFQFGGWAIGNVGRISTSLFYSIALLLENKEFEKPNNTWLHVLKNSGGLEFFILSTIQKYLNIKYDNRIQLSTDSSTPNRHSLVGVYIHSFDYKTMKYRIVNFSNKIDFQEQNMLPCSIDCIACKNKTFKNIFPYNTKNETYMIVALHNLFMMNSIIKNINKMLTLPDDVLKETIDKDIYKLYVITKEMVLSDHPLKVYDKYKNIISRYKTMSMDIDSNKINNFFKFD